MPEVIYEKREHIAFIRLNRPDSLNAINVAMAKELIKIWIDFRDDKNLWVAILSGEGKSFTAGADLKEMRRGDWKFRQSLLFGDNHMLPIGYHVWKPIIAAMQGNINGAGLFLALDCDIRIAADDAKFGIREAIANVPTIFASFLRDYMPAAIAAELLFTAKTVDAQRAYQVGLVNRVVPRNQLINTATTIAEEICECGPISIWATKELYCHGYMGRESRLSFMKHVVTGPFNCEDSIEGKQAFIEKRKPKWKVR